MLRPISSVEEINCDKGLQNDIIRVASFRREDFDEAVTKLNPKRHEKVQSSIVHPFEQPAQASLGQLDVLPLEILHEIFLLLSIESLFRFRQLNRRARQVASTVPGYQPVVAHAIQAFCIILRTKISSWYPLQILFDTLRTRNCSRCDSFAGFVFLLSLERCCFPCLGRDPHFGVHAITTACRRLYVGEKTVRKSIPVLRAIPGEYSRHKIDRPHVSLIGEQMATPLAPLSRSRKVRPSYLPLWGQEVAGSRYMAATTLPYLDPTNGVVQHGVCCKGCQIPTEENPPFVHGKDKALRERIYSHDEFFDHFRKCPQALFLWERSKEGLMDVEIPDSVKRGGYFMLRDIV